jgi:hypothetical protein
MGSVALLGATMAKAINERGEKVPKERLKHWMRWAYMDQRESDPSVGEIVLMRQVPLSFILFNLLNVYIVVHARCTLLLLHHKNRPLKLGPFCKYSCLGLRVSLRYNHSLVKEVLSVNRSCNDFRVTIISRICRCVTS